MLREGEANRRTTAPSGPGAVPTVPEAITHLKPAHYSGRGENGRSGLGGLHFTERAAHYPLPYISDVPIRTMGDEALPYQIVRRKGVRLYRGDKRPEQGIHISPQRSLTPSIGPSGDRIPGWTALKFAEPFPKFMADDIMRKLRPTLSPRVENCLVQAEWVCAQVRST
jgi:hypothetical protein